jgi:hypothetical protein
MAWAGDSVLGGGDWRLGMSGDGTLAGVYENPDWLCIHKVVHHQCEKCKNPELSRLKDTPPTEMTSLKEIKAMLGQLLEAKEDTIRFRKLMGEENARFWNTFMGALDGLNAGFAQAIGELRTSGPAWTQGFLTAQKQINEEIAGLLRALLAKPPRKRAAKRRRKP